MTFSTTSSRRSRLAYAGKTVALVGGATAALVACGGSDTPTSAPSTATQTSEVAVANAGAIADSPYKDGQYTAVGTYTTPGGKEEKIGVTVNLANSVITTFEVDTSLSDGLPQVFQNNVKEALISDNLVAGKSIDDLVISTMAGSSLSPWGFNDAIDQIKEQAKA
ncbi:hypothetical protein [Nocardia sp. 348MFTsu5.1]|uniref:hypothetical protein n=1 Tax=Nocardia sp. 348MFTsu5.1 TaxID=1172185 RepID=UPI00048EE8F8|nr:hypothetical protein [Nocardia sp. 348MFTsu5.1]